LGEEKEPISRQIRASPDYGSPIVDILRISWENVTG